MSRVVIDPPTGGLRPDGTLAGGWWHEDAEHGRIVCDLCPRECHLKPGDRGFCFVRQNVDNEMVLTTYGRSTGFCIDPIEKKPLNHFFPGTSVLSFGTAGCNLGCKFCQNWDISKSREVERLSQLATPDAIVAAAKKYNCRSVAFTYNDPIVWAEYAIDTAWACRAAGIATVAVTAGYISPAARQPFFECMDAANVDLKGFTEDFYYKITYSHLQPVLDTIEWLRRETKVWVELTNLIIPRTNDAPEELRQLCRWVVDHCGDETPVHFSAFHPDFRMRDLPPTPLETLIEAYQIARGEGLKFVYVGNVNDMARQSTYCPGCGELLIERDWYQLGAYRLKGDHCGKCGHRIAGHFADQPGTWGRRRQPVDMAPFAKAAVVPLTSLLPNAATNPTANASANSAVDPTANAAAVPSVGSPAVFTTPTASAPPSLVLPGGSMNSSAGNSPAENSPAENSPAENSPAENSPAENSPAENSPAENSPAENSPAENSPAENSSAGNSAARSASAGNSASGAGPLLTESQERAVLAAANATIARALSGLPTTLDESTLAGAAATPVMGAFVTLKRQGRLRACCGALGATMRLDDALVQAAVRTATEDTRLPTISPTELPFLTVDVNLLHSFRRVEARGRERLSRVEVGRHGLRIQRGDRAGLLLPSVPVENGWDGETYLRQVCRKAGLPTSAWESDDVDLVTFESREFGGPFDMSTMSPEESAAVRRRFAIFGAGIEPGEFELLEWHARQNIFALLRGATPHYYLPGGPDGDITGLALTVSWPGAAEPLRVMQLSLRPGIPLQSSLFQLCETVARRLQAARLDATATSELSVKLMVFSDPAMHGSIDTPCLRGIDTARRALVVFEQGRAAIAFDRQAEPEQLVERLGKNLLILDPPVAGLYSVATQCSVERFEFSSAPAGLEVRGKRRPAVAGAFYPADPRELDRLVTELFAASERTPERWAAALIPHAGLVYSGRLAAAVLNRLEIPETVIIIGPKHTPQGVEWAVAPQSHWQLPGTELANSAGLAQQLIDAIPGLRWDAAAHEREHSIEVELPLLARLAPQTRVVGITIGGGGWTRCQQFATGLANVLRTLPSRPLLLISSDMNHFATDAENRRLDEIALRAFESCDPERLLQTVRDHNISMCGVLPAVIVLEALRQLGSLVEIERVGYSTSADVTGDKSRVVGYAGMLVR
jgi:AmmeMemoRadiSam system radical SAM enzyme/AmmeMemoRadiSam system protein B/AmmeMemoRadiSam system protein A